MSERRGAFRDWRGIHSRELDPRQELQPIRLSSQIKPTFNRVIGAWARLAGHSVEFHPCFQHALAPLAVIAGLAASHHICPFVLAATTAWYHMIDREVAPVTAAVLTSKTVADEYFATVKFHSWTWPPDKCPQPNDRGDSVGSQLGMKMLGALLQNIRLPTKNEHNRTANVAHIQWFIVLVEHQNSVVHPAEPFGSGLAQSFAPGPVATARDSPGTHTSKRYAQTEEAIREKIVEAVIPARPQRQSIGFRNCPVKLFFTFTISSGVPSAMI